MIIHGNTPIYLDGQSFFELGRTDIPQPSAVQAAPTDLPTPSPVIIPSMVSVNQTGYFPSAS
ncbi:MAG TPA: hypothetical protein VK856_05715, partial [Anaerolineaceae bacterium]|nr:hypothetical protein [Anaerolineaceae bacterium]